MQKTSELRVAQYLAKNPREWLTKPILVGLLLIACVYVTYALEQQSIFLILSVMVAMKFAAVVIWHRDRLSRQDKLCLFLDSKDRLRAFKRIDNKDAKKFNAIYKSWSDFYRERHVIVLERVWNGFRTTVKGPEEKSYELYYLGRLPSYGFGIKLYHNVFGESMILRDWNSPPNLLRYALQAMDGGAGLGINRLIKRAHSSTTYNQMREYAKTQLHRPFVNKDVN